eukprot:TRINITY_DN42087_c0_g1_i1.p1 TRINITY_DN42087_c0_g1~~TRINITY_DN42087_c0_g1_i1.p1  ORF type:complete len:285 (-),score=51.25 TRINITY_DN42087_c0_g1_i1:30-884(-)
MPDAPGEKMKFRPQGGALCPGDTTQWEDIQRKMGNFAPKPRQDDPYLRFKRNELEAQVIDLAEKVSDAQLEHATLAALDAAEDDLEDDILAKYRQKRLAELKQAQGKAKFGSVLRVCKGDFVREVTEGSADGQWVVVLLYCDASTGCHYIEQPWEDAARRFPAVKFMKGVATDVVDGFPDSHTPAVLLYKDKDCKKQLIGLDEWGGKRCSVDCIEWALSRYDVVRTELEDNPSLIDAEERPAHVRNPSRVDPRNRRGDDSEDEDEDFTPDRCYSSLRMGSSSRR